MNCGIAGCIIKGRVKMTNTNWPVIDADEINKKFVLENKIKI